jgi:propanol-preferring alcohol dehydrogenase
MLAALVYEPGGPLVVEEVEDPKPGDGEVRVRIEACGIGLTVVHYSGASTLATIAGTELPRIPGHEFVGVVDQLGAGADPRWLGRRVFAYFHLTCGVCRRCLGAEEQLCESHGGVIGAARDGGYAEFAVIPERNALELPDGIDAVSATTIADAIATPVHAARLAAISPGERVAVVGAGGGVGIHMVQVAGLLGADVVGLDIVPAKLDYLERELGIPGVDARDFDAARLPSGWRDQLDVVVDLVGASDGYEWAVRTLDSNGRLVCLTAHTDAVAGIPSRDLVPRQLTVLGSKYTSRSEAATAAALVAQGRIRPIVTSRVGLGDIESVHDELRAGSLIGRAALVFPR